MAGVCGSSATGRGPPLPCPRRSAARPCSRALKCGRVGRSSSARGMWTSWSRPDRGGERMRGLRDRVAVVTGAANGIGAATARRLHEEGAKVAILDVDEPNGTTLAGRLGDGRALFIGCDVTSEERVRAAVTTTVERFGGVDVLVNNAGVNAYFDAEKLTLDEWERFFALDLRAYWLCSKHVLPYLRRQRRGVIVNVASIHARLTAKGMFPYAAAKSGVVGLTRSLALDYGGEGIRVVAVSPGWTRTRLVEEALAQ